jgi:hypothetical protein
MTVYTDRGAIPTPELDEPPHGPDQMAALADRVAALFNAPRVTETERDAIEGDDLYDGRLVMIVDSGGAFVRVDVYHADDTSDPAAGGTWKTVPDPTAVSIYQSSAQTIANTTETIIEFDTVDYDTDDLADLANNRIVLNKDGMWLVVSLVSYDDGPPDGTYRHNRIRHNSSYAMNGGIPPTGVATAVLSQKLVDASDGDEFKIQTRHNAGEDRDTKPGLDRVFLQATYIGQVI